jgi:hypothetical protein
MSSATTNATTVPSPPLAVAPRSVPTLEDLYQMTSEPDERVVIRGVDWRFPSARQLVRQDGGVTAPRAGRGRPGWPMAAHQLASAYGDFTSSSRTRSLIDATSMSITMGRTSRSCPPAWFTTMTRDC